jgi:DNA-binding response OmpR family regulator
MVVMKGEAMKHIPVNGQLAATSVLLIEDTPSQALRFMSSLENGGYHVQWAKDGLGGIAAARETEFALIILDIELPDIDGFEVCRRLKADPSLTNIPVVMLTTHDRAEDALTGLERGAIDYIPKDPFAEAVLLETLRQMQLN